MRKRYVVLGLSAFLALALTVPALGGPSNPVADISASAKKIAKKANKKAKKANQNAKAAQASADSAQNSADSAQSSANSAQSTADGAQAAAEAAQAAAAAAQASADEKFDTVRFATNSTPNNSTNTKSITAACPTGSTNTGGGFILGGDDPTNAEVQSSSAVILYTNGWSSTAAEEPATASNWMLTATARCISD